MPFGIHLPAATKATIPAPTGSVGAVTSVRKGDYIYKYRNGVLLSTTYSPVAKPSTAAGLVTANRNVSKPSTAAGLVNTVPAATKNLFSGNSGGTYTRGPGGTLTQTSPVYGSDSGSYYGQDNSAAGMAASGIPSVSAADLAASSNATNNDNNVAGEPGYGYTKDLSPINVKTAVEEYPMRILQQVMGQNLSAFPTFQKFMSEIVGQINNPFVQLLMNPGIGGKGHESTIQDAYNFQAKMMKNFTTPGGSVPDIGAALANIAAGLKNNKSGVYQALTGAGGDGLGAYGSQMDALNSMLAPILGLGASPLQQMITSGALNNSENNFLLNADFAKPQDPLSYVMKYLGYPTSTAAMPGV